MELFNLRFTPLIGFEVQVELALNIVWVLVAVGLICTWRVYWRKGRVCPKEATSITVLLVLLFFVISMTDDVHPYHVMAEDSTIAYSKRVHSAPAASVHAQVALGANPAGLPIQLHWLRADQILF